MIIAAPAMQTPTWCPPQSIFRICDPNCDFVEQVFASRTLCDQQGQEHKLDVFIPAEQGKLLYSVVRYLKPHRTLEVGLANGVSALHIAKALSDNSIGHHTAIDPFQSSDWNELGMTSLKRAGLAEWVSLDPRPSHAAIPNLESAGHQIQFAFIDGSHLLDYVMADFLGIDRILAVGGMIAFDDSDWPSVTSVIRFAMTNRDYRVFDPGIVIEPSPGHPKSWLAWIRRRLRRSASLKRILRHDFLYPSHELGINGRCVILQKTSEDRRDNQSRQLCDF